MSDTPTVLVVEDEKQLTDLYTRWLESKFNTRIAYSGKEALTKNGPDVDAALIDRKIPGPSGDELCNILRERGYNYPVAMVTAVMTDFEIIEIPFDVYVRKPIPLEELQAMVELLLTLANYDDRQREAFRLAQKLAILDDITALGSRKSSSEYMRLITRLGDLSDELNQVVSDVDTDIQPITFPESF